MPQMYVTWYFSVAEVRWDGGQLLHSVVSNTYPPQLAADNPARLRLLERTFRCLTCGKQYHWKQSLQLHLRHECGKEPQFQCPYCPQRTTRNGSLKRHIQNKHPGNL
ncbi:hypothetical protein Cfor_01439 [Coptotermes formosanus]|uniref:C2H2-type domain-containing protein n=1 Tax=Coptotermes formosanus TaxID=36987 RepID=A0A6L2PDW4_COPFO|nr:hypothetical protein Cfor_01439 [Coptotermes formosanus]